MNYTLAPYDARSLATSHHIPLGKDFHALDSDTVASILYLADKIKYRKPKHANGSRARYFYAFLNRRAKK